MEATQQDVHALEQEIAWLRVEMQAKEAQWAKVCQDILDRAEH